METKSTQEIIKLSNRGQSTRLASCLMLEHFGNVLGNQYHPDSNPNGIVNLGVAENSLCEHLMRPQVADNFRFTNDMQYYFPWAGHEWFRQALADFLSDKLAKRRTLKADQVVVTSGVTGAFDILAHFLADKGDCFLTMAPFYSVMETDLLFRAEVKTHLMHCNIKVNGTGKFHFDESFLETELQAAKQKGLNVKGLVIINPHNPTGEIFPISLIRTALDFAHRHDLNVIVDEIYAMSVFDETANFQSVLSLDESELPDKDRLFVLWGFSKDISLSGFRCGVIYSWNRAFLENSWKLVMFGSLPTIAQRVLCDVITDRVWLDETYFPTNRVLMRKAKAKCETLLREYGATLYPSKAGYFIFTRLHKLMKEISQEEELRLFHEFLTAGVYVVSGYALHCQEPGWFRITFTAREEILDEGLRRIETVLQRRSEGIKKQLE